MIKTPKFWKSSNFISELLLPFSVIYFIAIRIKYFLGSSKKPYKSSIPVICIGNPTSGGAGKTPTAIALSKLLLNNNKKICFVSKGYKGNFKKTIKVDTNTHTPHEVGDEAILLAQHAPCFVCNNREQGIKAAEEDGAEIIILDDGLQDRTIIKDVTISVIDGSYGLGNHLLIPAGPLRDRLDISLNHTDIVLLIGDDNNDVKKEVTEEIPIITAKMISKEVPDKSLQYMAFAGIGMPDKFFFHLESIGLELKRRCPFPDHHVYSDRQIKSLLNDAALAESRLITTEKDAIKIDKKYLKDITVYSADLSFDDEEYIITYFKDYI